MTQLSPLKWILLAPMIITILAMYSSSNWWHQTPQFTPPTPFKSSSMFSQWKW